MQNKTANQTGHKSTTKYTCTRKKRKRLFEKGLKKIVKQYLSKITPNLYDLINDHKTARKVWKIQISMRIDFISSKDTGEHNLCME